MKSMKKFIVGTTLCLGLTSIVFADTTNLLSDEKSRVSYAIGMMLGHNWQQQGLDIDPQIAARAIKDIQAGGATLLSQDEMQQTLTGFQQKFRTMKAAKNKTDGEAFLAANKSKPGVESLPDGLQYTVITKGTGATPAATDTVTVNYRGTLIDGTEFDSSYKRGQPASFPVGGVIRGWT